MTGAYLGPDFDLHSGGVDLVFTHHENEIAQSVCACGGGFAAHWFHIAHLLVDGGKMSKSLGNLHTLDDLGGRGWSAIEVRYVLLGGHYRKPLNFTFDSLHAAREALAKLAEGEALLRRAAGIDAGAAAPGLADLTGTPPGGGFDAAWQVLNQDLNTPAALGQVFKALKRADARCPESARAAWLGLHALLAALGLELPATAAAEPVTVPEAVHALAERRQAARLAKDWNTADALRAELAALGWSVTDAMDGYSLAPATRC